MRRALQDDAPLVLNADDAGVVEFAETLDNRIHWFSLEAQNPVIRKSLAGGGTVCYLEDDWLVRAQGSRAHRVVQVSEIPAAMGGVVRYNISNALAAMSIAVGLGIEEPAIGAGLARFRGDEHDNPGRGNWFEHHTDGGVVRILVDFAHNEHGMRALADAIRRVPAERVILLMGQAGDRLDKDITDLVDAACSARPSRLLVTELPGYERGRPPFEVTKIICSAAENCGVPEGDIQVFSNPREATAHALQNARPGDLLVLLALTQRSEALSLVHKFIEKANDG